MRTRLTDADPHVRECAIRVAGYFGFEDCIAGIFDRLGDDDEAVRRSAIEQLPTLDDPHSLRVLLAALREETPRNRAAAAHALRSVAGEGVETALIDALHDSDTWVRYFAAGSLAARGGSPAIDPLRQAARGDPAPHVRIAAVQALGRIDADAVVPLALELGADADAEVAGAALVAVAGAAGDAADTLLAQALQSTARPLWTAATQAMSERGTAAAVAALAWAARLSDTPKLVALAVDGLRRIAGSAAAEGRPAAVAALLALGSDPARREDIVSALGALPADAIETLGCELTASPRMAARVLIVEGLARMRHPDASLVLMSALDDDDAGVRAAAVTAFGRLGSPAAGRRIAVLRESDPDPAVRRRAAAVCQRYGWAMGTMRGER
jgi:HEAT repeat protein